MYRHCPTIVMSLGACIFFLGVISALFIIPEVSDNFFYNVVSLKYGSHTFEAWANPKTPIKFSVYFFNYVNSLTEDTPIFEQKGPYVYDKLMRRIVLDMDETKDTISVEYRASFSFNKDKSEGRSESDLVTIANPVALALELEQKSQSENENLQSNVIISNRDYSMTGTVGNFLFDGILVEPSETNCSNCQDPMKGMVGKYLKFYEDSGRYEFKFMESRNENISGPFVYKSGNRDTRTRGTFIRRGNQTHVTYWRLPTCNSLNASDLFMLPPMKRIPKFMYMYVWDACRSILLQFDKWTKWFDLDTVKYVQQNFQYNTEEDVKCYCPLSPNMIPRCPFSGTMAIKTCFKIDFLLSYPHFYGGDPVLSTTISGIDPDRDLHESFVIFEPRSGILLYKRSSVQINVETNRGILPMLWREEEYQISTIELEAIASAIFNMWLIHVFKWIIIALGVVLMLSSIVLVMIQEKIICTKKKKER